MEQVNVNGAAFHAWRILNNDNEIIAIVNLLDEDVAASDHDAIRAVWPAACPPFDDPGEIAFYPVLGEILITFYGAVDPITGVYADDSVYVLRRNDR